MNKIVVVNKMVVVNRIVAALAGTSLFTGDFVFKLVDREQKSRREQESPACDLSRYEHVLMARYVGKKSKEQRLHFSYALSPSLPFLQ